MAVYNAEMGWLELGQSELANPDAPLPPPSPTPPPGLIPWRDAGRNGILTPRIIVMAEVTGSVAGNGTNQPRVIGNGTTGADVVVESENIIVGGGA